MLNVKNVDPTSINVEFINDKNLISGKFHSVGSGYFPIWFAFCLQIPSQSRFLKSDVKVLPSDDNIVIEFFAHLQSDCKDYWYGLDRDNLIVQHIRIEKIFKENINALANGVSITLNDSDEDGDDDDVFDDKEENESKNPQLQNIKKSNDNFQSKDKNGKTIKEKGRKKKGKKIQKSNAIPIAVARSLPESVTKTDFIPGSLPIELNNIRPTIRGILKKRSLSECSTVDEAVLSPRLYSSSVDNVDTENSDVQESSFNDCKKTVRFNDHVIEKKINFNISIAAQAKKHRQRQQRKRNIREYNTPSESEASEAEDKIYGPLNVVSESEETSVSESSTGEMSDDSSNELTTISSKITVVADSKKDHKRRKSKSARKNASLAKQASTNNLIFPIEY
jgi:dynein assembly factor 2